MRRAVYRNTKQFKKLQNMSKLRKFTAYLVSDRKCEFKDVWAETQADAMNKLYGTIPPDTQIRTIREA